MRWVAVWAAGLAMTACGTEPGGLGSTDPDGGAGPADAGAVDLGTEMDGDLGPPDLGPLAEGQIRCELQTCDSERIAIPFQPAIDLAACCLEEAPDRCGYDLTDLPEDNALAEQLAQLELGCIPTMFEGELDPACPILPVDTGTILGTIEIPGCCRDTGFCGVALDLTNLGGPDLGCVPTSTVESTPNATPCGPG